MWEKKYKRTRFTKKWEMLKSQAEVLASQTGAEIKIIMYNPNNKKTGNFHISNITKTRELGVMTKMKPPLSPPPVTYSPSNPSLFNHQSISIHMQRLHHYFQHQTSQGYLESNSAI